MAEGGPPRVELKTELEVVLPSGEQFLLRPGPYGKGIAIVPMAERAEPLRATASATGKRGRRPRASTVRLRERLGKDAASGKLGDNRHYVKWLMQIDDTITLAVARQVVYRERRKHA